MAHYIFNSVEEDAEKGSALHDQAVGLMRVRMWGIDTDAPHRDALAAGDLVVIYLGAPVREFIGRTELASAVHDWSPSEAQLDAGVSGGWRSVARAGRGMAPARTDEHGAVANGPD